jgi:YHS domain-containing protein
MTRLFRALSAALMLLAAFAVPALAAGPYFADDGIAIKGTDVVAYFTEGRQVDGARAFEHEWAGRVWRFASAKNRDLFAADPEKYAPQYGGYCAWAVSNNYTAPIDPEAWRVVDGRLYLNYSKSVQGRWVLDVKGNIAKADRNWPEIGKKLAGK